MLNPILKVFSKTEHHIMTTNNTIKFYIDTNVLVYYLKSKYFPALSKTAKLFLQKIEKGNYIGTISALTIAELIKSLREIMVKYEKIIKPSD